MVRTALVIAAVAAAHLAAGQAKAQADEQVLAYGSGATKSCALWLSTPAHEREGFAWIVGFWSGLNFAYANANADLRADVGRSTDGWGIVGEVKQLCMKNPSSTPLAETLKVYRMLRDQSL